MTTLPILRPMTPDDLPQVSALHDRVFGPGRYARSAYRVREGRSAGLLSPYCRVGIIDGRIMAAINLTDITIGGIPGALQLGPVVVESEYANQGHGRRIIGEAMDAARHGSERLVVLVGDEPYYRRYGFAVVPAGQIWLPGPVNPARLLAAELVPGSIAEYHGLVEAC